MASAIDIASTEPAPPDQTLAREVTLGEVTFGAPTETALPAATPRPAVHRRRTLPRLSPLTRRIIAVNVLPLALLAIGFLYLGKFAPRLIGQQVEALRTQGGPFAAALRARPRLACSLR